MQGPDFELGLVSEWQIGSDGLAHLSIVGASRWTIATTSSLFSSIQTAIELGQQRGSPIFVSGERRSGRIERVLSPRKLIPAHIANEPIDGKIAVVFHGPPTPAHLRMDRPWFMSARAKLMHSVGQETAQTFPPPLLITIDVTTNEIMDVREP